MEFKTYQSRLSELSARFNLMVCLVFGLLIANLVLSSFVWQTWHHRTIEITPFSGNLGYVKNDFTVDNHYLSLMAENFINERLNVSPETVDGNHKRLLGFVDSSSYSMLSKQFAQEAHLIKTKRIASTFDITQIKTNPNALTVTIFGILKRFVGFKAIHEARMSYQLHFRYAGGRLSILSFSSMKENQHD